MNSECGSEMCCMRLAGNTRRKNDAKKSPSAHHCTTLSGYIFATEAHIDNRKKNLLSSNTSPTCSYNMVNVGPLAAEIVSLVWGHPNKFQRVSRLGSVTAQPNSGVEQRAPPMLGRAAIRLGIGPHSSFFFFELLDKTAFYGHPA